LQLSFLFFLQIPPQPTSPLFPYTTLFRSVQPARLAGPLLRRRDRHGRQHLARRPRRGPDADAVDPGPQRRLLHRRPAADEPAAQDRKSTRLNSSHLVISYAVFCLKKKKTV